MNNDSVGYSVKATGDANVKDLNQLEGTPPKDTAKTVVVKAEPKSDAEVAAEKVKVILGDAAPFIRQLQDIGLNETKWSQTMRRRRHEGAARAGRYENKTQIKKTLNLLFKVNVGNLETRGNSAGNAPPGDLVRANQTIS